MYRLRFRGLVILLLIVAAMALVSYLDRRRDPLGKPFSPFRWCWARLRQIDFVDAAALLLFAGLGVLWAKAEFATAPSEAVGYYVEHLLGIGIFMLGGFYVFLLVRMFVEDGFGVWLRRRDRKKADAAGKIEPPQLPRS